MQIAIYNRALSEDDFSIYKKIFETLSRYDIKPVIFEPFVEKLKAFNSLPEQYEIFSDVKPLTNKVNFLFSFGGDGTLLDTVKYVGDKKIPILGINLGRLGFLASTKMEEIEFAIDSLQKGAYLLDNRTLIHLDTSIPIFQEFPFALNEFSIHRKDSSSLIKIHTYLNGEFLCTYWADGLIVSTPTGSTGYSLSCGGPIIFPQANSFVITPVAPHNLNVRPLVISDKSIVSFEVEGRAENFLCTLDSRSETIDSSVSLAIRKENFDIQLVRLEGQNFLHTLQTKLYWGVDSRN
jgi:NAD+ kinase